MQRRSGRHAPLATATAHAPHRCNLPPPQQLQRWAGVRLPSNARPCDELRIAYAPVGFMHGWWRANTVPPPTSASPVGVTANERLGENWPRWQGRPRVALWNLSASPPPCRPTALARSLERSSLPRRSVALGAEVRRRQPAVDIARPRNREHAPMLPVERNVLLALSQHKMDLGWRAARPMSVARFLTWASLPCRPSGASLRFRTSE